AVRNSWTYVIEPLDSAKGVPTFTDSIIEFDTARGKNWAVVQRSSLGFPFYYRIANDGLHEGMLFDNLIAKYPARKGDQFVDSVLVFIDTIPIPTPGSATVFVVSNNETVTVPAGTFQTLRYDSPLDLTFTDKYYAPGVG